MQFVTFAAAGEELPGLILDDETLLDLRHAFARGQGQAPSSLHALIAAGPDMAKACGDLAAATRTGSLKNACVKRSHVRLLAPIPRPPKNVFCVGRNYADHVAEGARAQNKDIPLPQHPQFFTKPPTAIVGPDADVPHHKEITEKLDYEVELALIIGTSGKNIPKDKAYEHIFGYTILNDITARDLQRRHDQWFKGKGLDGSCPIGPWIVHKSALANPQNLDISLTVNGETRQHANTSMMIFDIPTIVATLSAGLTLEAGDIIATGTPSGVGYAMDPPVFLKDGDVVECRIEGIGTLRNRIKAI